jgi:hypothetical protein
MLQGNTADAIVLLPVVDRLRERFHIGRVCVVADRGMISAATITALEERKLEYILGARERSSAVVRRFVLEDEQPLTPLLVDRARGETQLFVKEVKLGAARYILCRNEAEAERERNERQAIVAGLSKQLARGDEALIGNSAYRRYLRRTPSGMASPARHSRSTPANWPRRRASTASLCCAPTPGHATAGGVALPRSAAGRGSVPPRQGDPAHPPDRSFQRRRYPRPCILLTPRPDAAEELTDLCRSRGLVIEWADLLCDLDRLQEATIEKDGRAITARTAVSGQVGNVFQAAGIALPPNLHERAA